MMDKIIANMGTTATNVELAENWDYMENVVCDDFDGYTSDDVLSISSSSDTALWSGFLMERFPRFGTEEFKWLKEIQWPRYGLDKEHSYNHKPVPPDWFESLRKEVKQELMNEIFKEQSRLVIQRNDECLMTQPHMTKETLTRLIALVPKHRRLTSRSSASIFPGVNKEQSIKIVKYGDMRELTRYLWEKKWLLFKESCYPKLWSDVVGDKDHGICSYMEGLGDGDRMNGTWGLILNEALRFEQSFEKREDNWQHFRRYQNLDGSEIRPVMTVYREMRNVLQQEEAELMDVFFQTLPISAFPMLDPEMGFWRNQKSKASLRKRPITISLDIVMVSDINTVDQRFTCMFEMEFSWKQTIDGARNYYIKEQLDELDEMSTNKEKVYKPEWKPPEPIFKNAIASKLIKETSPYTRDEAYNILYSNATYRATFSEKMELENFPFDCQEFHMSMDIKGNDFDLKGKNEEFIKVDWEMFVLDEWKPSRNAIDCTISRSVNRACSNNVVIAFKLERDPSNYVYKLVFTSFMIVSGTFMFFGISNDNIEDRLNYIATMFLTGQAFQMVAINETPSLGYLTMIDKFLVIGNLFIYMQFSVAIFINFRSTRGHPKDAVNRNCLVFSAGLYLIFTIAWVLWARLVSIPKELLKLNATQLDVYSRGFIYIITYLGAFDGSEGEHHFSLLRPQSTYAVELSDSDTSETTELWHFAEKILNTKLGSENNKKLKITQIVGKRLEDDGPIYQNLSGLDLKDAVEVRKSQPGDLTQHPKWKRRDMDRIKAKKLKMRKERNSAKKQRAFEEASTPSAIDYRASGEIARSMELRKTSATVQGQIL